MKNKVLIFALICLAVAGRVKATTYTLDCGTPTFTCNVGDTIHVVLTFTADVTLGGTTTYSTTNFYHVVQPGDGYYFIQDVNNFFVHCMGNFTSVATGIGQYEIGERLFTGPNPANDLLHIVSEKFSQFKLYDLSGRLVLFEDKFAEKIAVDISLLSPGIYYLTLTDHKGRSDTRKIIKD
jgi:hypothetical protein